MIKKVKKKVAIAIQCRLSSSRLPNKSILPISSTGITAISSLIQNCRSCADHVEAKRDPNTSVSVDIIVLVPEAEYDYWVEYLKTKHVIVRAGSMTNVLSRYTDLLPDAYDYIMRLTADCPNVPQLAMNKAIWTSVYHDIDYCSNVWEKYRTSIDGHDIEIMSWNALNWLRENANSDRHKEHVTLAIRELMPPNLKKSALLTKEDLSDIKLCIDTEEEYQAAKKRFNDAYTKKKAAIEEGLYVYEY
jgi:spore coat polysaccharide biosynthesis protein SpsF